MNADAVVKTLELMKAVAYMDPEFHVSESTFVQKQLQQGKIAYGPISGPSRLGALDDAKESQHVRQIRRCSRARRR